MVAYRGSFIASGPTADVLDGTIQLRRIPQVTPIWGKRIHDAYGVCAHPNFADTVYDNDAWLPHLAQMGVGTFRGGYAPNLPHVRDRLEQAKTLGLGWLALPVTLKLTDAEIRARLDHIKANSAPAVGGPVEAIEPVNEPDKDGLTDAEVRRTVEIVRLIWEYVTVEHPQAMAGITVLSPALQMAADRDTYQRFADAGIRGLFHAVSVHHYSGDQPPDVDGLKTELDMIQDVWSCDRFWVSETGYTNALDRPANKRPPVSEDAAAAYALPNLFGFLQDPRVEKVFRYEGFDDPEDGLVDVERHFGMWRCPSLNPATWEPKPERDIMAAALAMLADDATSYTPTRVDLELTVAPPVSPDDVVWRTVTQNSDGVTVLWLWQPYLKVWDLAAQADLAVSPVEVTVTDVGGERSVLVGKGMTTVRIET